MAAVAFLSLLTRFTTLQMRPLTAATGEVMLRGYLIKVADVDIKLRAAKQAGFTRVVVPSSNYQEVRTRERNHEKRKRCMKLTLSESVCEG
jgi:predicted ATP-dependent serine protease